MSQQKPREVNEKVELGSMLKGMKKFKNGDVYVSPNGVEIEIGKEYPCKIISITRISDGKDLTDVPVMEWRNE